MNIGAYGILIVFGAFVLLLVFNPNLSCFGKRIKSPLYPVFRRRSRKNRKKIKTEDYGFSLGGKKPSSNREADQEEKSKKDLKTQDYGFDLGGDKSEGQPRAGGPGRKSDSHQDESSDPSGE